MLNIFITNLGKYNEGYLIGEWVELPVSDEELNEVLEEIGINEEYEEYFIIDYETSLGISVGEYESIGTLNRLMEEIEGLNDTEVELLKAILELYTSDLEEALDILRKENFSYIEEVESYKEVGEKMLDLGILGEIPENIINYINFEALGRDLAMDYSIASNNIAIAFY